MQLLFCPELCDRNSADCLSNRLHFLLIYWPNNPRGLRGTLIWENTRKVVNHEPEANDLAYFSSAFESNLKNLNCSARSSLKFEVQSLFAQHS